MVAIAQRSFKLSAAPVFPAFSLFFVRTPLGEDAFLYLNRKLWSG
uniref:Uncharacterized protein n=1 Tax=Anguilla anguilla TaxID=7936 RepID=A0A0E9VKU1_ANGAN